MLVVAFAHGLARVLDQATQREAERELDAAKRLSEVRAAARRRTFKSNVRVCSNRRECPTKAELDAILER
jgi:hypothetical protein